MKIITLLFLSACLTGGICASCSSAHKNGAESPESELHVVSKVDDTQKSATRMPLSDVTSHFQLDGKSYEASVFRTPDETLPLVKNEQGDEFVDNRITLRITATDGRQLLDRSFTKASFASLLNERFMKYAILEGIVYDTVKNHQVLFAASVSYPESDLYVPIRIAIAANGDIHIEKTDLLDDYDDEDDGK